MQQYADDLSLNDLNVKSVRPTLVLHSFVFSAKAEIITLDGRIQ